MFLIEDWLEWWTVYGLPWLIFALYILVAWMASGWVVRLLRGLLTRLTARGGISMDERELSEAAHPVRFVMMTVGLSLGLNALSGRLPSIKALPEFQWINKAAVALVILAVTGLVNAIVKAIMDWYLHNLAHETLSNWDNDLLPLLRRVVSAILYFLAVSFILTTFGVNISALVTTAGVASLAVSLAAQDTLSNVIGGVMILVDRPFRVGNTIELLDGRAGVVQEISLRTTRIRLFDGNALVVPNKDMANTRIINYAQPTERMAIRQTIGVGYGTDIDKAKQILLDTIKAHPEVLEDPAPGVWFTGFGVSSLDLFMSCWVGNYSDQMRIKDELNRAILKAFRQEGIEIPFPQQDVHLHLEDQGESSSNAGSQTAPRGEV